MLNASNKLGARQTSRAPSLLVTIVSLDFSPSCLSVPVTNDGCPISARFWQMWDSADLDR
jgi:hypothetical protein